MSDGNNSVFAKAGMISGTGPKTLAEMTKAVAQVSQAVDSAAAAFAELAARMLDGMQAAGKAGKTQKNLGKSTSQTAKTVTKANKAILASFDELDRLPAAKDVQESIATDSFTNETDELVTVGDSLGILLGIAGKAIDAMSQALRLLSDFLDILRQTAGVQTGTLNVTPGLLDTLSDALSKLLPLLKAATSALGALNTAMTALPNGTAPAAASITPAAGLTNTWGNIASLASNAFQALTSALSSLWQALAPFTNTLGAGLAWLYNNVLVPLGSYAVNQLLPAFLKMLASALGVLSAVAEAIKPAATFLFENLLKPLAEWTGGAILDVLDLLSKAFDALADWITSRASDIGQAMSGVASVFVRVWETIKPVMDIWKQTFQDFFTSQVNSLIAFAERIFGVFDGIEKFLSGVFSGNWGKAWEGVKTSFANVWKGITGLLGSAINLIIKGVNGMIASLNRVSFSVPSWVPSIGGNSFGFKLAQIPEIPIPKLASGAVIPANREFLAVLGDQKSGRNLEAPESLIRQIVREESGGMGEQDRQVFRDILTAIREGQVITVNETVLGRVASSAQNAEMRRLGYTPLTI